MPSALNVCINGLATARGRKLLRELIEDGENFSVLCLNEITMSATAAKYLLEHDTVYGNWDGHTVEVESGVSTEYVNLVIDGKAIPYYSTTSVSSLPLSDYSIDVVFECSGNYNTREKAYAFITAGAKRVVIMQSAGNDLPTVVYNINQSLVSSSDTVISVPQGDAIACAVIGKALNNWAGYTIEKGNVLFVGSYPESGKLQDAPYSTTAFQLGRAGAGNMIKATTGAAKAIGLVIPELNGKIIGTAVYSATIRGSMAIGTFKTSKFDTDDFTSAYKGNTCETIGYSGDGNKLVSGDIIDSPYTMYCGNALYTSADDGYLVVIPVLYDAISVHVSNAMAIAKYLRTNGIW